MKLKLYDFLDSIFTLVVGILFIIFPEAMMEWIGMILGIYFALKAVLCFFTNISPFRNTLVIMNVFFSVLTFVFWGFFLKFIMFIFGIIVTLLGLMKFLNQDISGNKKEKAWNIITAVVELLGGIAIISISFTDAHRVLGIVTGIILIFISILLFINNLDKHKWNATHEETIEERKDVIDAEIINETTEDVHD